MSIEGTWFATDAPLTFLFQQQDGAVSGVFHDEKTYTCELKGTLVGNRLSFNFETSWSWLNVHDMGSATLDVSADGATLSGPVLIGGKPGRWTLRRTKEATRPPPPPAPPQPPAFHPPPGRGGGGGNPGPFASYHDGIVKQVWDAGADPALLARLKARAKTEPELHDLLLRRKLIDE
jgi:hypothetical protein